MKRVMAALVLAIGVLSTAAAEADPGGIAVDGAWARATPKGAVTGVVYVTLANNGPNADRLLGASSPIAETIQFHSSSSESGVMKMDQLSALDLAPGETVTLKPGGIHMMMLGLTQPLREGQTFPLTLTFETAHSVEVTVRIGKIGAMEVPGAAGGG
ncbi:copper chaperone PCu(A)C [Inquilinus sp. Marseille-Q2685]|uniref:copper chaperone PCu(A)C n=1 Tax=Inquilinus sp. Marseille-Q2685 TaxID=2866581 RepID=UPI001CE42FBF|nr:copper chaperone PCu(A)C [Inquilinus sp. Marseille-Q2685]